MMNDLVQRLRQMDMVDRAFNGITLNGEAADMIEALQANGRGTDIAEIKLLHEQIETLQAENNTGKSMYSQMMVVLFEVQSERDRYRTALIEVKKAAKFNQSTWGHWIKRQCAEALGEEHD